MYVKLHYLNPDCTDLLASPRLVLPQVEESVHDRVHDGVDASKDEQGSLDTLVELVERLVVAKEPEIYE